MAVEIARPPDASLFGVMWRFFLEEDHDSGGSHVLPTDRNVEFYQRLFVSYTMKQSDGISVFAIDDNQPVGVILQGEIPGGYPLDTDLGKPMKLPMQLPRELMMLKRIW